MIVLLIVSLALAATAPIMSQKAKTASIDRGIPSGAVIHFNLTRCPSGWTEMSRVIPNSGGHFIRIADPEHPNRTLQEQSIQEHWHNLPELRQNDKRAGWTGNGAITAFNYGTIRVPSSYAGAVYRDNERPEAPYVPADDETRPKNLSLTACVKD